MCICQQTKAAIDVVASLVGDLNPPDTEPRKRPQRGAASAAASDLAAVPEEDAAPQQHASGSGAASKHIPIISSPSWKSQCPHNRSLASRVTSCCHYSERCGVCSGNSQQRRVVNRHRGCEC